MTFDEQSHVQEKRCMSDFESPKREPGTCVPWEEKRQEIPEICGDEAIVERTWKEIDALGYMYVWQCLVSF